jgi:hypothetical protein
MVHLYSGKTAARMPVIQSETGVLPEWSSARSHRRGEQVMAKL